MRAVDTLAEHRRVVRRDGDELPLQRLRAVALDSRLARRRGLDEAAVRETLLKVHASYREFLERLKVTEDGLGVGSLSFVQRRILVGELIELTLLDRPGEAGRAAALEQVFAARANGALARSLGVTEVPTIERVRRDLLGNDQDGLIVLLPSANHIHLFALDRREVLHARLDSLESLLPDIEGLWGELSRAPQSGKASLEIVRGFGAALGGKLFPDAIAEKLAHWERLHLVGADLLQRLPIGALSVPGIGILGLERELVQLPSVAVGLELSQRESEVSSRLLVLASPTEAEGVRPMAPVEFVPGARRRLETAWNSAGIDWRTKKEAHLDSLRRGVTPRAMLLFSHGDRDPSRPRPLSVRLAPTDECPDGRWFPDVLEDSGISVPPVVVLAACHVADVEMKAGGDDSDHLGASFLRRGARVVLLSSAPLEQASTSWLSTFLLEGLAEGLDAAAALEARAPGAQLPTRLRTPALLGDPRSLRLRRTLTSNHDSRLR